MANPFVQIELGGKSLTLRIGHEAIGKIEAVFGDKPITKIFGDAEPTFRAIHEGLYHGLNHKGQRVTREQLYAWLDENPAKLGDYGAALGRALTIGLTGKEPDEVEAESGKVEGDAKSPSD